MKTDQTKKTENGKVPEGYRRTAVGIIPHEWKVSSLDNIGDFLRGKGVSKKDLIEDGLPCVTYGELYTRHHNVIRRFTSFISEKSANDSVRLKQGDILFAGSGETIEEIGKSAAFVDNFKAYAGGDIVILRQKSQDPHFLGYLLNHEVANRQKHKQGQGHSVVHIYPSGLKKIKVPLPPLFEQQKIATILLTWDDAIEKTQKLIDQLKQRNKGLAEQLLTGKKRLKGFKGEWRHESLGMYFKERKEFGYENLPLLSVGESGVYHQSESNKKDTSNEDKASYKRICVGDIGYNTMRMWQGRSALSAFEGIVSPAYTVVTPKPNADAQFFSYLFKLQAVIHKFYRNSQGLVSDTLNCKFKDFKIVKVDVPPSIMEQKAVASLLDLASDEMRLYTKRLTSLQRQKKGLMQRLLTGEIRVKLKS